MPELPWIFTRINPRSLIDIFAVSLIFFWLLWFAQRTRAAQLIRGLVILIVGFLVVSNILDLTALNWLLSQAWPVIVIALPIIFQPELRRALEQLGHAGTRIRSPFATHAEGDQDRTIDEISRAAAHLSRIGYGALLVIERDTGLQEYVERAVVLDAAVSRQLLINIFFPNSPLHDGAVIIRDGRILAANCILPLSERELPGQKTGTRHQAAIGITEESDAIAVVVSEETNRISVAHNGRLTENLDAERLRRALRKLMGVDREQSKDGDNRGSNGSGRMLPFPALASRGNGHADGTPPRTERTPTAPSAPAAAVEKPAAHD